MRNVSMMTRSRLTPISVAVVGSWATARMPRPNLVRLTNWSATTIMTSGRDDDELSTLRDLRAAEREHRLGLRPAGSAPALASRGCRRHPRQHEDRSSWMTNEAPMAVMRKTSRGALRLRSGR